MFTGIVQGVATVAAVRDQAGLRRLRLRFPADFGRDLALGASVAVDGVCLTVAALEVSDVDAGGGVQVTAADFDVMQQTLRLTTLGGLALGERVNVERAAREGAEVGGHILSGHVDFTAQVLSVRQPENNHVLRVGVPRSRLRYLFAKGYVAVNGASLTLAEVNAQESWFEVWLIPETLRMTTFGDKTAGAVLNIELERGTQVMVDTVEATVNQRLAPIMPLLQALAQERGLPWPHETPPEEN